MSTQYAKLCKIFANSAANANLSPHPSLKLHYFSSEYSDKVLPSEPLEQSASLDMPLRKTGATVRLAHRLIDETT